MTSNKFEFHSSLKNFLTALALSLLGMVFCIPQADAQMLDSLSKATLDSALKLINLHPEELGFDKMWVEDDTFRLDIVEKMLDKPLELPGYVDELAAEVDTFALNMDVGRFFNYLQEQLAVEIRNKRKPTEIKSVEPVYPLPFTLLLSAFSAAEPLRKEFYSKLDSLDLNDMIMSAPNLWNEDEDSLKALLEGSWQFEVGIDVDTSREVDSDRLLDIIAKFDTRPLLEAAGIVLTSALHTRKLIDKNEGDWIARSTTDVDGVKGEVLYYFEHGEYGRMVVGGEGDNVYEGEFSVIIDMGGDDVYRGRCGGAMGELGYPYSVIIDIDGDDYYDANGKPVSHGAGFFGVGILLDCEGNDTYRSGAYSQGAGLFGAGVLIDMDGNDDYRGEFFQQGAAHCGVGLLIDKGEGDDRYLASAWAQGFASTYGYGLHFDEGGDEIYRTGGVYYHAPLLPHDYRSFSGGFGMGWRPRAGGGIGVLYDKGEGNDFYNAEVMSFGSSYWYSLGILIDGGGNDHYSLAHYGLGSGIHLSVGALYDISGDDQYRSRHGVVGGTPHDLSVGIMVDGKGDDYYIVSDGWGGSLTNSFGLFIDRLGNDTYATRGSGYSLGNARWARGFAGAGIFLDLEGDDVYPRGEAAEDSSIWIRSGWGIGIDLPRDVIVDEKEEEVGEIELTAEDSAKTVEELFKEASQWEVGSARKSVARARKALLTKGVEALDYTINEKLDTQSSLVKRLLETIVKEMPDSAGPRLIDKLESSDSETVLKNTIWLLGTIKWEDAVDPMLEMLDKRSREKERNSLISALGQIGDNRASEKISKFIADKMERRRLACIGALASIKDSTTIGTIVRGLNDQLFTVRSAAAGALMQFGNPAFWTVYNYISDENSRYPDMAIKVLGRITAGMKEDDSIQAGKLRYDAVSLFEENLSHPNDQVRAAAVDAFYRTAGEKGRQLISSHMEKEYSPVVIAAYDKVRNEFGDS